MGPQSTQNWGKQTVPSSCKISVTQKVLCVPILFQTFFCWKRRLFWDQSELITPAIHKRTNSACEGVVSLQNGYVPSAHIRPWKAGKPGRPCLVYIQLGCPETIGCVSWSDCPHVSHRPTSPLFTFRPALSTHTLHLCWNLAQLLFPII